MKIYRLARLVCLPIIPDMLRANLPGLLLIPVLYLVPLTLLAAIWDLEREREVAEKLSAELESGEIIWLPSARHPEFPAIYTLPETNWNPNITKGTVVLLHGMGGHPDWPVVISPLRKLFKKAGWVSLSIQLPVLSAKTPLSEYGNTVVEAGRRISIGIDFLNEQEEKNIIVIGYGFGAAVAARYLDNNTPGICGFVGISMLARKFLNPQLDLPMALGKLKIPLLDIYGSNDQKIILQTADDRRLAAWKNGNQHFTQINLDGADQNYLDQEKTLFNQIMQWLDELELKPEGCNRDKARLLKTGITGN